MLRKLFLIAFFLPMEFVYADSVVAGNAYSPPSGLSSQRVIVKDSAGKLYIAYSAFDSARGHYQVYIARSSNGGVSWEPSWMRVTGDTVYDNIKPSIAVDATDTLHIVWVGGGEKIIYSRVVLSQIGSFPDRCAPRITHRDTLFPGSGPSMYADNPAVAVDAADNVYVVFTASDSSIKFVELNRSTDTWGSVEDVSSDNPANMASIEVDASGRVHLLYRGTVSGRKVIIHQVRDSGVWSSPEYVSFSPAAGDFDFTSLFADQEGNLYAVWDYYPDTGGDSVIFRKFDFVGAGWREFVGVAGAPSALENCGDVIVDTTGMVYVFYYDGDSVYFAYSYGGEIFRVDSAVSDFAPALMPNARGSNFPGQNRVNSSCTDYVYTWAPPESSTTFLVYDRICDEPVCADFLFPLDSTITSCYDQPVRISIQCCRDTLVVIDSDPSFIEYWDTASHSWRPVVLRPASDTMTWRYHNRVRGDARWIWSNTGSYGGSVWFRALLEYPCSEVETAFIEIQCDNQAFVFAHDTVGGYSGSYFVDSTGSATTVCHGDGWWTLHSFDLTPFMSGGTDTLYIRGYNEGSTIAGLMFRVTVVCGCCPFDTSTFVFAVNSDTFTIDDSLLSWDGSVLEFAPIPPDTYAHHDTITACLVSASDSCGRTLDIPLCRTFFVDYQPPILVSFSPPADTVIRDTMPEIVFEITDSLAGVDTSSIRLWINSSPVPFESLTISSTGSTIVVSWQPDTGFDRGETVSVCIHATDSTDYCEDNSLDTCWSFVVRPCADALVWKVCPAVDDTVFVSCTRQEVYFGIMDTTGSEIDTTRIYFTAVIRRPSGEVDTLYPALDFVYYEDTLVVGARVPASTGDTVIVILDSLFTVDDCKTEP